MITYQSEAVTLRQGDTREVMAQMPEESVQTVVTSPPYWGLRDYGTATWLGGDPECPHLDKKKAGSSSTLKNDGRPNPWRPLTRTTRASSMRGKNLRGGPDDHP